MKFWNETWLELTQFLISYVFNIDIHTKNHDFSAIDNLDKKNKTSPKTKHNQK